MDPLAIIAIIGLTPVVILTLFKSNAATAYLALCLGSVLGKYVAEDTVHALKGYIAPATHATDMVFSLALLWIPVLLVAIFMAKTISSKQRLINLLPALAVGLVGILLSVPFLTPEVRAQVEATDVWKQLTTYQAIIAGVGTAVSLVLLRLRKHEDKHGKHH
jgi:hypothetical protein